MSQLVMLIDTKKCTGCHTCAMACKVENNLPNNIWWNQVFSGKPEDFTGNMDAFTKGKLDANANIKIDKATGNPQPTGGVVNVPGNIQLEMNYWTKACQHCENPACMEQCPANAIYKDEVTGIVDTYFEKCIGCDICITACPYDVRHHNDNEQWYDENVGGQGINQHKTGTVDKCTLCHHKIKKGEIPACVEHCPAGARKIGYINDPTSEVYNLLKSRQYVRLLEDKGTGPSVYFLK